MESSLQSLKAQVASLTLQLKERDEKYAHLVKAYDQLLLAFKQSQRRTFGARSERFIDAAPAQGDLFSNVVPISLTECEQDGDDELPSEPANDQGQNPDNDANTNSDTTGNSNSKASSSKTKKPKKSKPNYAKGLTRREVIIPAEGVTEDDNVIRYEVTELLHYVPPVYELIIQKREVVVSKGTDNVSQLRIAPNPKRILPKASVTESFLAHMIVSKLYDRQPLYHLEKKYHERFEFICPRNKLSRWFIDSSKPLQGLVNLLQDTILDYDVTFCDPTYLQVLGEPGRPATQKSYVFTLKGGPPDKSTVLYTYNPDEHKSFLKNWFMDYEGYLHVDGQNIFDAFADNPKVTLLYCNSHARRKFEPIAKSSNTPGLATQAMQFYKALYAIERQAKQAEFTPDERKQLRHEKAEPLINGFEKWVEYHAPLTLPQSPLGGSMEYVQKRFAGLRRFLEDGRLEIDTNGLEQKNKDFALARNNFRFAQSVAGAKALCIHSTLVFTALEHKLDPYYYYVYIMEKLPYCATVEALEDLLPWNVRLQPEYLAKKQQAA